MADNVDIWFPIDDMLSSTITVQRALTTIDAMGSEVKDMWENIYTGLTAILTDNGTSQSEVNGQRSNVAAVTVGFWRTANLEVIELGDRIVDGNGKVYLVTHQTDTANNLPWVSLTCRILEN